MLDGSQDLSSEDLDILRKISKNPDTTQRKIANDLGVSLGKVNYCLIKLKEKGIIKINNLKFETEKYNENFRTYDQGSTSSAELI